MRKKKDLDAIHPRCQKCDGKACNNQAGLDQAMDELFLGKGPAPCPKGNKKTDK